MVNRLRVERAERYISSVFMDFQITSLSQVVKEQTSLFYVGNRITVNAFRHFIIYKSSGIILVLSLWQIKTYCKVLSKGSL